MLLASIFHHFIIREFVINMDTSKDDEEMLQMVKKFIVIEYVILSCCTLLLIIYSAVAVFVFRKIGLTNLVMSFMIISIGLVIVTLTAFFSVNMVMF